MAETEGWCSSSSMTYTLHVFKEKPFVLFEESDAGRLGGAWANYPEVTPYFLVVIEDDGTNKRLFTGGPDGTKKIRVKTQAGSISKRFVPHQVVSLSENGLELSESGIDEAIENELTNNNTVNWKGLYYTLGYDDGDAGYSITSFKDALANTNSSNGVDKPNNDLEIVFDYYNPFQVVAYKTWNTICSNLLISFDNFIDDPTTDLPIKPRDIVLSPDALKVALKIDNVDLIREEIQRHIYYEDGSLEDFVPGPGQHIDDTLPNPGRLVVKGIVVNPITGEGKTYDQIIEILVDEALGNTGDFILGYLPSGGGVDWIQVAAADIYNSDLDSEVFKCVWEIHAPPPANRLTGRRSVGEVWPSMAYRVYLNPRLEYIRFNQSSWEYSFAVNWARSNTIWHESLHSYSLLRGKQVNDEDNDRLHVKQGGGYTPYHIFSYDHKLRGFLRLHPIWEYLNISTVKAYLHGLYGDNDAYDAPGIGRFMVRLDDKLTEEDLKRLFIDGHDVVPDPFIDFGFPDDMPYPPGFRVNLAISIGMYLYLEPGIDFRLDYLEPWLSGQTTRVSSIYGYYDSRYETITEIKSWAGFGASPDPRFCFDLIKRGRAKLYATVILTYIDPAEESDASYFSTIARGPRIGGT